jgi:hypothetical protein
VLAIVTWRPLSLATTRRKLNSVPMVAVELAPQLDLFVRREPLLPLLAQPAQDRFNGEQVFLDRDRVLDRRPINWSKSTMTWRPYDLPHVARPIPCNSEMDPVQGGRGADV